MIARVNSKMPTVQPMTSRIANHPSALRMLLFATLIGGCWAFPRGWYTKSDPAQQRRWLQEKTEVPGWFYVPIPVAKSAEAVLVADELVNGEFSNNQGDLIRVFSAKRFQEKLNEIGLFVHTPDRCWTQTGWTLEHQIPDSVPAAIHTTRLVLERRIFNNGANGRELVYFGGLVGGQSLPYRLDHNLSVGMRHQLRKALDKSGATLRASDQRFWTRVWESFWSRREILGPKQFIRISTPLPLGAEEATRDALLMSFLPQWLEERGYHSGQLMDLQ